MAGMRRCGVSSTALVVRSALRASGRLALVVAVGLAIAVGGPSGGSGMAEAHPVLRTHPEGHTCPEYRCTLTVSVLGSGRVQSVYPPGAIDCPGDCSETFLLDVDIGTYVTLRAVPAPGWVFVGWGEACARFGRDTCSNLLIRESVSVSAAFEPAPLGPTALITFEDLPPGMLVASQYLPLGVAFTTASPYEARVPVVTSAPGEARSGSQVASICTSCRPRETPRTTLSFSAGHRHVELYAGVAAGHTQPIRVRLRAFDSSNALIAERSVVVRGGGGYRSPLTADADTAVIRYVVVDAPDADGFGAPVAIDDVSFEIVAPTRPAPIFSWEFTNPRGPISPVRPPAPPPPSVTIVSPRDGQLLPRAQFIVTGAVSTPGGLSEFCVALEQEYEYPGLCENVGSVAADGSFRVTVSGLRPGWNRLTVWVMDRSGQVAHQGVSVEVASGYSGIDLRVVSIEVNQVIQFNRLPVALQGVATYNGVRLASQRRTVVRVFANAASLGRLAEPLRDVPVVLYGRRTAPGQFAPTGPLEPLPLTPIWSPRALAAGPASVPTSVRTDPGAAYTFALPSSWVGGTIELRAEINPTSLAPAVTECANCRGNNNFTLRGVRFYDREPLWVRPISFVWRDGNGRLISPPGSGDVFADTRMLTPDPLIILPYQATFDVTWLVRAFPNDIGARNDELHSETAQWRRGAPGVGFAYGVSRGLVNGVTGPRPLGLFNLEFVASGNSDRPKTSIAHEFWHLLGAWHASASCGGGDLQFAEGWPTDERGYIQGIGIDPRMGSGGSAGPYRILDRGVGQLEWYDLMSYCARTNGDPDSWISTRNWNRRLGGEPEQQPQAAAPALTALGPTVTVDAMLHEDGSVRILAISRGTGHQSPPDASAPYQVVARDLDGAVLANAGVSFRFVHTDGDARPRGYMSAEIPAERAAQIEIMRGELVLANRVRSPKAPTVTIERPRAGEVVGEGAATTVAWTARDGDGDALTATVDYSADDGKTWRTVTSVVGANQASVPSALLMGTQSARLRVTVTDGFNATEAVSARFRAVGRPPSVRILDLTRVPPRVRADATVTLQGEAFDDASRRLTGSRLRWYHGRRLLGTGATVTFPAPLAGLQTIRLVARDASGRPGASTARLRVIPVVPRFRLLRVPRSIPTSARSITLRLAATVPATLRIGGRRHAVGRRLRLIRVRIPRGHTPVKLTLRLSSSGLSSAVRVVVTRRR